MRSGEQLEDESRSGVAATADVRKSATQETEAAGWCLSGTVLRAEWISPIIPWMTRSVFHSLPYRGWSRLVFSKGKTKLQIYFTSKQRHSAAGFKPHFCDWERKTETCRWIKSTESRGTRWRREVVDSDRLTLILFERSCWNHNERKVIPVLRDAASEHRKGFMHRSWDELWYMCASSVLLLDDSVHLVYFPILKSDQQLLSRLKLQLQLTCGTCVHRVGIFE